MSEAPVALRLPERFVIGELPALKGAVEACRASGAPVVFDAEAVRSVDSAALQFLLVCRVAGAASGEEAATIVGAGDVLRKALADIGVTGSIVG